MGSKNVLNRLSNRRALVAGVVVAAVTVLLSARLFRLIDAYAVNGFFYDQWVYTWALLEEPGRTLFASGTLRASHPTADPSLLAPFPGPIPEIGGFFAQMLTWYQGLGAIVTEMAYGLSRWSTRAEGFVIFAIMIAAMACAFALKVRLYGRLSLSDCAIAIVFMTPHQLETFIGVIYASHIALPILLSLVFCFCWLIDSARVRYPALVGTHFVLTFTGHGFLLGAVAPLLFVLDARHQHRAGAHRERRAALLSAAAAVATLALWWFPQVSFVVLPCERVPAGSEYVRYIGAMFARMLGAARNFSAPPWPSARAPSFCWWESAPPRCSRWCGATCRSDPGPE